MKYIQQNLIEGETIIKEAKLHWFIYVPSIILFIFATFAEMGNNISHSSIFIFTFAFVFFLDALIKKYTTELAVTNRRVIAKYGLITRKTIELNLKKVESLSVEQGIMGRIFDFGNIIIGGTGGKKSPIKYITAPLEFRKKVNEQIEEQ